MTYVRSRTHLSETSEAAAWSERVALASRLVGSEPREPAIQELLIREGRDVEVAVRAAAGQHPALKVHAPVLLERVLEIAARRYLEHHGADPAGVADRILAYGPAFLPDLCLGVACAERPRNNPAWNTFVLSHQRALRRTACDRGFAAAADDEVNAFLADLWVPRRGGGSFIGTYSGLAPIGAWSLLVFRRRLARRRGTSARAGAPTVGPLSDGLAVGLADSDALDPGAIAQRVDLRHRILTEVRAVVRELPPRDRDFLESKLLRGEEGRSIAARCGVSPSYVSKRCRQVVECVRKRLAPWMRGNDLGPEELR